MNNHTKAVHHQVSLNLTPQSHLCRGSSWSNDAKSSHGGQKRTCSRAISRARAGSTNPTIAIIVRGTSEVT